MINNQKGSATNYLNLIIKNCDNNDKKTQKNLIYCNKKFKKQVDCSKFIQ